MSEEPKPTSEKPTPPDNDTGPHIYSGLRPEALAPDTPLKPGHVRPMERVDHNPLAGLTLLFDMLDEAVRDPAKAAQALRDMDFLPGALMAEPLKDLLSRPDFRMRAYLHIAENIEHFVNSIFVEKYPDDIKVPLFQAKPNEYREVMTDIYLRAHEAIEARVQQLKEERENPSSDPYIAERRSRVIAKELARLEKMEEAVYGHFSKWVEEADDYLQRETNALKYDQLENEEFRKKHPDKHTAQEWAEIEQSMAKKEQDIATLKQRMQRQHDGETSLAELMHPDDRPAQTRQAETPKTPAQAAADAVDCSWAKTNGGATCKPADPAETVAPQAPKAEKGKDSSAAVTR